MPPAPGKPINLTAIAERLPRADGRVAARLLTGADLAFELLAVDEARARQETLGRCDEVYIVISGYGTLRCGDAEVVEFTAGDVLFVPAGAAGRFRRLSRGFKTWRISLGSPAEPG